MKSPGLLAGGIAVTFLGAATVPWGVVFIAISTAGGGSSLGPVLIPPGIGMLALGAAGIAGGIVMMAVGAKQVPISVALSGPSGTPGATLGFAF